MKKRLQANFKKLLVSGSRVVNLFHTRRPEKFFCGISTVLELGLIVNVYVTLYTVMKEPTINKLLQKYLLSKSRQSLCKMLVKDELYFLINLQDEGIRLYLKKKFLYIHFARIFSRYETKLYSLLEFQFLENLFYTKPFRNCFDSSAKVLCRALCNVIRHVCINH